MKRDKFIVGTRGSQLAQIYTKKVINHLEKVSSTHIETKKIVTSGDENQKDRLSNIGGKGLFSKKIEIELINNNKYGKSNVVLSFGLKACPSRWFTPIKGIFRLADNAFPKFKPTVRQTIKPGPDVEAIAETSFKFTPLSLIAFFAIKSIFST